MKEKSQNKITALRSFLIKAMGFLLRPLWILQSYDETTNNLIFLQ